MLHYILQDTFPIILFKTNVKEPNPIEDCPFKVSQRKNKKKLQTLKY